MTQQHVSIRKISDPFSTIENAKNVCREIKMLRFFKHMNIIELKDILNPVSMPFLKDVIYFKLIVALCCE